MSMFSKSLLLLAMLTVLGGPVVAEMVVETTDGRVLTLPVDACEVRSIGFRSGGGQAAFHLGSVWDVEERGASGDVWNGTWTRRPGTNLFDAVWKHNQSGQVVQDVIEYKGFEGGQIIMYRHGLDQSYRGTVSADKRGITGTADWYTPGVTWVVRIR